MTVDSPAFGQADLTNCERELIHLAGSVQPHGVLLLLREDKLTVLQASDNCHLLLGLGTADLLDRPLATLGGDLARWVKQAEGDAVVDSGLALGEPVKLRIDGGLPQLRLVDEPRPCTLKAQFAIIYEVGRYGWDGVRCR